MISEKDVILEYSIYDEYANVKHGNLDKNLISEITEKATKIFEDPITEEMFDAAIFFSMNDDTLKEYSILRAITECVSEDTYLCNEIESRIDTIKDLAYLPESDYDDAEFLNDFEYEREEDDRDCQFD